MSFFVIGDEDTILGFKLVGVPGQVVSKPQEAKDAFMQAVSERKGRIILISERLAKNIPGLISAQRASMRPPYVVEIPDRNGPLPERKPIQEIIREAIGIRI